MFQSLAELVELTTVGRARPPIGIYRVADEHPVKQCVGSCTIDVPGGLYVAAIRRASGTYEYDDLVTIRRPTKILFDPGDKTTRRTLIVFGSFLTGGGAALALFGAIGINGKAIGAAIAVGGVAFAGGVTLCFAAGSHKPSILVKPL